MTYGECATASLLIAVRSGVALAIAYDPADALASVAMMQLANPAGAFFRNVHYWSAQGFLVLSLLHAWDHVRRRDARPLRLGAWIRICLSLPAVAFVAWSGFVLKGDTESLQALRVVGAALSDIPVVGGLLAAGLFGRVGSLQLIYVHHAATFTFFVWFVFVEHGRLLWPRPAVIAAVLAPAALTTPSGSRSPGGCSACGRWLHWPSDCCGSS